MKTANRLKLYSMVLRAIFSLTNTALYEQFSAMLTEGLETEEDISDKFERAVLPFIPGGLVPTFLAMQMMTIMNRESGDKYDLRYVFRNRVGRDLGERTADTTVLQQMQNYMHVTLLNFVYNRGSISEAMYRALSGVKFFLVDLDKSQWRCETTGLPGAVIAPWLSFITGSGSLTTAREAYSRWYHEGQLQIPRGEIAVMPDFVRPVEIEEDLDQYSLDGNIA